MEAVVTALASPSAEVEHGGSGEAVLGQAEAVNDSEEQCRLWGTRVREQWCEGEEGSAAEACGQGGGNLRRAPARGRPHEQRNGEGTTRVEGSAAACRRTRRRGLRSRSAATILEVAKKARRQKRR